MGYLAAPLANGCLSPIPPLVGDQTGAHLDDDTPGCAQDLQLWVCFMVGVALRSALCCGLHIQRSALSTLGATARPLLPLTLSMKRGSDSTCGCSAKLLRLNVRVDRLDQGSHPSRVSAEISKTGPLNLSRVTRSLTTLARAFHGHHIQLIQYQPTGLLEEGFIVLF